MMSSRNSGYVLQEVALPSHHISLSRRRFLAALSMPLVGASAAGCSGGGSTPAVIVEPANPWASDFATLAGDVASTHPDPSGVIRSAAWPVKVEKISREAPAKTDAENIVAGMSLAALLKDEHTRLNVDASRFARVALQFDSASDGYFARWSSANCASLLGLKLVAIDGIAVDEVTQRLAEFLSVANRFALRDQARRWFHSPEFLHLAGVAQSAAQVSYLLEDASGLRSPATLAVAQAPAISIDAIAPVALPLWRTQSGRNYFLLDRTPAGSVYVRYRMCADLPSDPMGAFMARVVAAIKASPAPRVVFDLRDNPGGNSGVLKDPLTAARDALAGALPRTAVLVNNGVYSSALINAYDLRQLFGASSFGEPPGTPPNGSGNYRNFTLPRTGTGWICATRTFTLDPADTSGVYAPDFAVGTTIADMLAGRDPVLDRAEAWLGG